MPITVQKFQLDRTGLNPDNLIENEIHNTVDISTGLLIPEFKNFFTESLIVRNHLNETLERNVDYVPTEFNSEASLMVGKEICTSIILITNLDGNPITISYQVLGGTDTFSSKNLIEAYIEKVPPESPIPYADIIDKPIEFSPVAHHLHDADEMYGLEYVVNQLNRILHALQYGSYPTLMDLIAFTDTALLKIRADTLQFLDANMQSRLDEFLLLFNREFIGVENIENLGSSEERDGYNISNVDFNRATILEDKYVLIETLIGLKKGIYENLIRKDLSGLDLKVAKYGIPAAHGIKDTGNYTLYTAISKNQAIETETIYSDNFYPITVSDNSEVAVVKLNNSVDSNDTDILLVDRDNLNLYHGNVVEEIATVDLNWKTISLFNRVNSIDDTLESHIEDNLNPHNLTKEQIQLEKVENLPVVTVEEVEKLKSVRSYITFDTLLLFARKHFLQNGPPSPADPEFKNRFLVDHAVVVYSPAGKSDEQIVNPTVTGLDGSFLVNTSVGWTINGGEPNSIFTMKTGLNGTLPTTRTLTLNNVGGYTGYLPLGSEEGVVQTLFTFKGNRTSMHNSVIIVPSETVIPAPPPPAPVPSPPPPPPAPAPAPIIINNYPPPAPPPPVYIPTITLSTNRSHIVVGYSETLTIKVSGAEPSVNFPVTLTFKYLDGKYKTITQTVNVTIDIAGTGQASVAAGNPRAVCQTPAFGLPISSTPKTATGGLPAGRWGVQASGGGRTTGVLVRTINNQCWGAAASYG